MIRLNSIDHELVKVRCSNKKTKILIQNPGKSNIIKDILSICDKGLFHQIPDAANSNNFRRMRYIVKKMIYVVDDNTLHSIWIRGSMGTEERSFGHDHSNVSFCDPKKFNYWKLPERSFDILISEHPVKLKYLKSDGIIIDNFDIYNIGSL